MLLSLPPGISMRKHLLETPHDAPVYRDGGGKGQRQESRRACGTALDLRSLRGDPCE